jgi:outer membrane receptor for ferrienterochelin and colicin
MGRIKSLFCWPVLLLLLTVLVSPSALYPQQADGKKGFDDLSLEELLDTKIAVASKTNLTQRESPGIISVITQAEIMNSGARDLIDVLLQVPGFMPALDVQNGVGIGIRGSWAHEGKALLLVDGQEFNETLYSTLQFGNHFPLEQISRIEIIRGPGSATYGGYAELGVINIITKSAADVNGVSAALAYGQMAHAYARRTVSLSAGKQGKNFGIVAHSFFGQGNRSDRNYTDAYGNTFNLEGNSDLDPLNFNIGLGYKGFSTRFIVDRFHETTRDFYDQAYSRALDNDFNSYFLEAKYDFKLGQKFALVPKFNYKRQSPWQCISEACREEDTYSGKTAERFEGSLALSYNPTERVNFLAGGDFYYDRAHTSSDAPDYDLFLDGSHEVDYDNGAFFAQGLIRTNWVDITLGGRVDHHSQAGNSFAPRFGLTKVKGKFHVKGLISKAFRAPAIENLLLNPKIEPERTTVMEFEAGYQITKSSILTGNVFNSRIKKPIVYAYDIDADVETYQNFSETGTRGFELDYRVKKEWGYVNMNYSYYRAIKNEVDSYSVENHLDLLLGFPAHKLAAAAHVRFAKGFFLNPSLVYLSSRYGYTTPSDSGAPKKFDPAYLANLNFSWRDIASQGLDLDIGIYDIFGQNFEFIQPYKGSHAPLPGPSREFRVRLAYRMNFLNK